MSGYYNLKQNIIKTIKDNGRKEITGQTLQVALVDMINSIGANYQLAGIATPSTNPGAVDANVFYLASTQGTYINFNNIIVDENELAALYKGASDVWYKWHICSISASGLSEIENNSIATAMLKDKSVTNAKIADYAISAKQLDAALWVALSSIGINGASFLGVISSVDDMPKKGLINRVTGQLSYDYDANGFYIVDFSKFSDVENGQYVILKNFNGGGLWGDSLRIKKNEGDVAAIIANGPFGSADAEYVDLFHFNSKMYTLADGIVTTNKLANFAVTTDKIENGAVTPGELNSYLKTATVGASGIYLGTITPGSYPRRNDGTSSDDPFYNNEIRGWYIATEVGVYSNFKLPTGSAIEVTDITKLNIVKCVSSGMYTHEAIAVGGGSGSGSSGEITDGSITTAKLANSAVTAQKLADGAVTSAKILDGSINEDHFGTDLYKEFFNLDYFGLTYKGLATPSTDPIIYNLSPTRYGFFIATEVGTYTNFKKSGVSVSVTQEDLNSNIVIIKWSGAGWVKELIHVPVSTGTGTGEVADGSITSAKLASSSVTETKISSGAVTTAKLADLSVSSGKLANSSVTTDKLNNSAVTEGKIASSAVTTAKIANYAITLAKLSSDLQSKINSIANYLPLAGGTMSGDIVTPNNDSLGIRPSINNYGQIGSSSYHFYRGYINNLYIGSNSSRIYESSGYLILDPSEGVNIENDLSVTGFINCNNYINALRLKLPGGCEIWGSSHNDSIYMSATNDVNIQAELSVDGSVYATSFSQTSDYRLKNILEENIVLPLDTIADAPSIRYNLKNDKKETMHLGTIAQYWANVAGDDVAKKNSEGYYSLESTNLSLTIGISLAKHLREANDKIASLEERLKALEDKLNI